MFEVLKQFYTVHYNFGALAILLLMLLIFLLTKKNLRIAVIILAALIAMNVFIYKRTEGKVWTITIDPPPAQTDSYGYSAYVEPTVYKFSALKNWTITDENGKVLHWCWLDELWDGFANTDLVAAAWGENASKKMTKSTEERASGNE